VGHLIKADTLSADPHYTGVGDLASVVESAHEYIRQARAPNTIKAYNTDWADFTDWCTIHRFQPLPASENTMTLYLTQLARRNLKVSTLTRRISAVSQAHQLNGFASPTRSAQVRMLMAGIRRIMGTAPPANLRY
jgi:hypothetical protein